MKRVLLLSLVALVVAAPAEARTAIAVDGEAPHYPYKRWVFKSKLPTPEVGVTIYSYGDGCGAVAGATSEAPPWTMFACRIYWWDARWVFYHELGHVLDASTLTNADRARFTEAIGLEGVWYAPWETAGERFADAYARCASPTHAKRWRNRPPLCRLIWRLTAPD